MTGVRRVLFRSVRYQLLIEYVGTDFRGWQIQKKGSTIQGLIQEKLTKLLKEKIILNGSGRTDTGVHASAVREAGLRFLNEGDELTFEVEDTLEKIVEAGNKLIEAKKSELIILGCAGMARHRFSAEKVLGIRVIDPVHAALDLAIANF